MLVIELRQVVPDDLGAVGLDTEGIGDPAALTHEPLGMFLDQGRIDRAVVDDQIDHHRHPQPLGLGDHGAHLGIGVELAAPVDEIRVDAEIVRGRIETARAPGLLDRVDEHPVEAHGRRPLQMRRPLSEAAHEPRKYVVDLHTATREMPIRIEHPSPRPVRTPLPA